MLTKEKQAELASNGTVELLPALADMVADALDLVGQDTPKLHYRQGTGAGYHLSGGLAIYASGKGIFLHVTAAVMVRNHLLRNRLLWRACKDKDVRHSGGIWTVPITSALELYSYIT